MAEHFDTNKVSEVYKIKDVVNGKHYPWVSYTLDFKKPLDVYEFIDCGHIKNRTQINNSIYRGIPVNNKGANGLYVGLSGIRREIPKLPSYAYDRLPCSLDNIFLWSKKPYGLCVDFTEAPMPELIEQDNENICTRY